MRLIRVRPSCHERIRHDTESRRNGACCQFVARPPRYQSVTRASSDANNHGPARVDGRVDHNSSAPAESEVTRPNGGSGEDGGGGDNNNGGGGYSGDGAGRSGDGPPPSPYPLWLRAWLIACGAVYWLLLRPRLFGERAERKRLAEREAAEFQRYEDDWARLVSRYTSPGDSNQEGAQSAAPSRRADASGGSDGAAPGRLPNGPTGHGHHSRR